MKIRRTHFLLLDTWKFFDVKTELLVLALMFFEIEWKNKNQSKLQI